MRNLLVVLTGGDLWRRKAGGRPVLYWSLEGLRKMASQCWVHFVYRDTPQVKASIDATVRRLDWLKIGDAYPVSRKMPTAYGAMMAFPSFDEKQGFYLFDSQTVFAPDLLSHMGDVDWFPYSTAPMPNYLEPLPSHLGVPPVISPLGLYSFGSYQKFFNLASEQTKDPILIYKNLVSEDRIVASEIPEASFQRANSVHSITDFNTLLKEGSQV